MSGEVVEIDGPSDPGIVEVRVETDGRSRHLDFDDEHAIREYDGERVIAVFIYGTRDHSDGGRRPPPGCAPIGRNPSRTRPDPSSRRPAPIPPSEFHLAVDNHLRLFG